MPDTAIDPIPKQGKFRRALAAVGAWLQALDYTGFDYKCRRHLKAEEVMRLIADIYDRPSVDFRNKADRAGQRRRAAHSAKTSGFRNLSILEALRHLARFQRRPPADVMR